MPDREAHQDPAHDGAPEAADAAEHDDQEGRDHGIDAHVRPEAPDRRQHDAREAGETGAQAEDQQAQAGQVDPQSAHHLAVVGSRLDDGAVGRALQEEPDAADCDGREQRRVELVFRVDQPAEEEGPRNVPRHLQVLLGGSPEDPDGFLDDERRAEGEQQSVLRLLAVGPAHAELETHADDRDKHRRHEEGQSIARRQGERPVCLPERAEPGKVRVDDHQREVGTEREQRPVSEVDHLHHAHDEHEAQRDQREQETEAQPVQEVGENVRHGATVRGMSALTKFN